MTYEEYLEKLKTYKENEIIINLLKPTEFLTSGITFAFDFKIVSDVYSLGYLKNIDYLSMPSSKIYLIMIISGLIGYISIKYLEETVNEENMQIQKDIDSYQLVKK